MSSSRISVVIPVYNVEKYLDRCVESVVNQTHTDLEIILVEDGSPDGCAQICDTWAERDGRIKVIHKANGGLSAARNTGIEAATGEFICFIDSDDYIDPGTIEDALSLATTTSAEVVMFGMRFVSATGEITGEMLPMPAKTTYRGKEIQEIFVPEMIGKDPRTGKSFQLMLSACSTMFSSELIHRTSWRFVSEKQVISEDIYALLVLFKDVKSVSILSNIYYNYCENTVSVTRSYRADRNMRNRSFYLACLDLCDACGYTEEAKKRCSEPYLGNTFAAMKQIAAHYSSYRNAKPELQTIITDEVLQQVLAQKKHDHETSKKKIFYWAIRNKCYFLCYLLLVARIKA